MHHQPRISHTAIWTGSEMIVWGGHRHATLTSSTLVADIIWLWITGRLRTINNAPTARHFHTAIWTGAEMIVWGGLGSTFSFNTGGRYNPVTDNWTPTRTTNAPDARYQHTAIWAANEMIVWGGIGDLGDVNTGGRYSPTTDSWIATQYRRCPSARDSHTAVWSGAEMIVWGGWDNNHLFQTRAEDTTSQHG